MNNSDSSQHPGFSLFIGILLIIAGIFALSAKFFIAASTIYFFGWILLITGFAQFFGSFFSGSWGNFFMLMVSGILSVIAGGFIVINPAVSIATFAVLVGIIFMIDGIYKFFTAFATTEHRGRKLTSGILLFFLGLIMWGQGPVGDLLIMGFLVGMYLIIEGFATITNAYAGGRRHSGTHTTAYR